MEKDKKPKKPAGIWLLCVLSFYFFPVFSTAQKQPDLSKYKTKDQKLSAWARYCDEFLFVEDHKSLMPAARKGLAMTPKNYYWHQSLFNFYVGISFDFIKQNDSVVHYLEQSLKYSRLNRLYLKERRTEETLMQLLLAYSTPGKVHKKEQILSELLKRADTVKDSRRKGNLDSSISVYYINLGEYEKGMHYRLGDIKAIRSYLDKGDHNDSINFGVALVNVGELYLQMKNPQKASEYLKESQGFILDYPEGIATTYKDLIDTSLMQKKPDEALKNYKKLAAFLTTEVSTYCHSVAIDANLAFADYYLKEKNIAQALQYTDRSQKLVPKYGYNFQIAQVNQMFGKIYLEQKKYDKALEYLEKAEPVIKEDSPLNYSLLQKSLAETYAALGNWQLAYRHFNTYSELQDNLLTEKAKSNLAKMEAQYQNKKKQGEINMLSAENKIKNLSIENANRQRVFFIIGLGLLVIIGGLIFRQSQNRKKTNGKLQLLNGKLDNANQTKAKLFSIISHDLRSPISHIYQFLDLQKTEPELFSEADKIRHNNRISKAANTVLETMEDLLIWSKSQMQQFSVSKEKINILQAVENIAELMQTQTEQRNIHLEIAIPKDLSIISDRNILTIMLRNILQNALKFSPENDTVSIKATQSDGKITLSISDNGKGIPPVQKDAFNSDAINVDSGKSGLGLTLVKEMAELIGATVRIAEEDSQGTEFLVSIPNGA
ncbi:MAG TPA: ATP-binding protein [Flavobacterium sp.]|nr:ATP-binding protein [Flavobacterium sp.]